MNKIHLLAPEVAQKIAAGEVIERPVSVVKELVENSLDAGATEVRVELHDGGKTLLRVADNGFGMSRDDAALCFRRHSTSKIAAEEDLERIATLGFRGEALASIAAVSRLVLRTFDGSPDERGTMIEREGERLLGVSDIAFPRGTTVEVRDLFFNLPARRKFLRSSQSELGLIAKYLTQAALGRPASRFTLVHGTREIINCPAVGGLRDRIFQLYGKAVVDGLMEVKAEEGECRVGGFASRPLMGRGDRTAQHFFVNGRPVKDRVLLAALNQAYTGILERNRSAEAFLFVEVPYGDVDVNVHPAKSEVRFRDSQLIFRLVLKAVEHGTLREHAVKGIYPVGEDVEAARGGRVAEVPAGELGRGIDSVAPELPGLSQWPGPETRTIGGSGECGDDHGAVLRSGASIPNGEVVASGEAWASGFAPARGAFDGAQGASGQPTPLGRAPVVLGQFDNLYIVASSSEGLLVIDQHNAHERVLFEKYREIDRARLWPRQMLLVPVVMELTPSQTVSFEENAVALEEIGFRAEAMSGRSIALKEYPGVFSAEAAAEVFLGLLEDAGRERALDKRERMLATMACKTAIKAGQPLTPEKMGYLVAELFKTSQPALCPHGRPIVVRIDKVQIDKGMRRA